MDSIKLSTEVQIKPSEWKLNYDATIVTVGSCFAETLGGQLLNSKFRVLSNPFGTVFNPVSISKLLQMAIANEMPNVGHYLLNENAEHFHYDFHSSIYSSGTLTEYDQNLRGLIAEVRAQLKTARLLVLTFGTAYAYRLNKTGEIVANCHKTPASQFKKELLSIETVTSSMESMLVQLKAFNPNIDVVLTVSPVRHTKETLPLNQVSKSVLRLATHLISEKLSWVNYFPSYEVVMDELRDYRFYEPDLIHPDSVAREHIFRLFVKAYLDKASMDLLKEWTEIKMMLEHRPQHGFSEGYKKHLLKTKQRLIELSERLDVGFEMNELESIIASKFEV